MKKNYVQPEVEMVTLMAIHKLLDGTGGGLYDGNGQETSPDPFGSAPWRY